MSYSINILESAIEEKFVLLNKKELCALQILDDANTWMYGQDIIEASNGVLKRGAIYIWLGRLIDAGLITRRSQEQYEKTPIQIQFQLNHSLYKISPSGRRKLVEIHMSQQDDLLPT